MSLIDVESVPRRTMTLFFLADTSGSMEGSKIGTLNQAIEDVIPEIKDISENNADGNDLTDAEMERIISDRKSLENMWKDVSEYVQTALETLEQQRGDRIHEVTKRIIRSCHNTSF